MSLNPTVVQLFIEYGSLDPNVVQLFLEYGSIVSTVVELFLEYGNIVQLFSRIWNRAPARLCFLPPQGRLSCPRDNLAFCATRSHLSIFFLYMNIY